jgi:hypothetical protein
LLSFLISSSDQVCAGLHDIVSVHTAFMDHVVIESYQMAAEDGVVLMMSLVLSMSERAD